tara:strand:- start:1309 stop:1716 length:408 start_codon:yes stop_codon:yes gene_type:complete
MGFLFFLKSSIQNGSSTQGDGVALYNVYEDTLVQFISYEGIVTSTNGAFSGAISVDIGISQNADPIGTSLQLQGDLDSGFVWVSDSTSYGQINVSQSFVILKWNYRLFSLTVHHVFWAKTKALLYRYKMLVIQIQ